MPPANLELSDAVEQTTICAPTQGNAVGAESPPDEEDHDESSATPEASQAPPTPPRLVENVTPSQGSAPHPTVAPNPAGSQGISSSPSATTAEGARDVDLSPATASPQKMLFSDVRKSKRLSLPPLLRPNPPPPPTEQVDSSFDPDLVSKDKTKQKDAVRRHLSGRIKNDWSFPWPPIPETKTDEKGEAAATKDEDAANRESAPPAQPQIVDATEALVETSGDDDDDDAVSTYSSVTEDLDYFQPRHEWLSDVSDDDIGAQPAPSAYRFDSPDTVGETLKEAELARAAKRRRLVREEMGWNPGLACFNARRDAWTGAKTARVRPKQVIPVPKSPPTTKRRSIWRLSMVSTLPGSPTDATGCVEGPRLSASPTRTSGDTTAVSSSDADSKEAKSVQPHSSLNPIQTLIPIAPPILPPANPMRASITPSTYPSIYDKIVLQSMTPACPVNLGDVIRSCVTGWKRDGEWPPRPIDMPPPGAAVRRRSRTDSAAGGNKRLSLNFLSRKLPGPGDAAHHTAASPTSPVKESDGSASKGIKRSLQRVFGLGADKTGHHHHHHHQNSIGPTTAQ